MVINPIYSKQIQTKATIKENLKKEDKLSVLADLRPDSKATVKIVKENLDAEDLTDVIEIDDLDTKDIDGFFKFIDELTKLNPEIGLRIIANSPEELAGRILVENSEIEQASDFKEIIEELIEDPSWMFDTSTNSFDQNTQDENPEMSTLIHRTRWLMKISAEENEELDLDPLPKLSESVAAKAELPDKFKDTQRWLCLSAKQEIDKYISKANQSPQEFSQDLIDSGKYRYSEKLNDDGSEKTHLLIYDSPLLTDGHAWKMHIYCESLEETQKLGSAILPYLREAQIAHKIVNALNENVAKHYDSSQEYSDQFGKTITIYPASIISFEQIAKDINHIIKQNNLQTNDSNIVGDRLLDDTGRIFYRYDGASKSRPGEYDENRGGDKYMAADMTTTDDPFVNLRFEDKV